MLIARGRKPTIISSASVGVVLTQPVMYKQASHWIWSSVLLTTFCSTRDHHTTTA